MITNPSQTVREVPDRDVREAFGEPSALAIAEALHIGEKIQTAWCAHLPPGCDLAGYESAMHHAVAKACRTYRPGGGSKWSSWVITLVKQALSAEATRQSTISPVTGREKKKIEILYLDHLPDRENLLSIEAIVIRREEIRRLREAVSRLSPRKKNVISRYYYLGEDTGEIARTAGRTRQSVHQLMQRGLADLRRSLGEEL